MITKVQYKKIDDKGIVPFSVKNDLTLEILTEDTSKVGGIKSFRAGGTFYGELVRAKLSVKNPDGSFKTSGEGVGLMVRNDDNTGCWLIPAKQSIPMDDNVISRPKLDRTSLDGLEEEETEVIRVESKKKCGCKENKIFGFSYKQLAFIGVLLIVVKNI